MERWNGRVALVTGASAGIGAAICQSLVRSGMKVVGVARRVEKIQELAENLKDEKGTLLGLKCDISKDEEIYAVFAKIKETFGGVDICINNAGMSFETSLLNGTPSNWRHMMDINVISVCLFSKLAVESMGERNVDDGHIINISSISSHPVFPMYSAEFHFYITTKHALRALTSCLRQELKEAKSHIRVSGVSPGLVKTEFFSSFTSKYRNIYDQETFMDSENIANVVLHIISSPPHVEVYDIILRST